MRPCRQAKVPENALRQEAGILLLTFRDDDAILEEKMRHPCRKGPKETCGDFCQIRKIRTKRADRRDYAYT